MNDGLRCEFVASVQIHHYSWSCFVTSWADVPCQDPIAGHCAEGFEVAGKGLGEGVGALQVRGLVNLELLQGEVEAVMNGLLMLRVGNEVINAQHNEVQKVPLSALITICIWIRVSAA